MPFTPTATYRIQFHKDFGFRHLQPLVPYLASLGISTIYSSPLFKARPGSTHGYDVTDAGMLNPEIGTMQEFEGLQQTLKQHHMSWLQDIVPNHMAFHQENKWLMDVLEKGPASEFYNAFDVNWNHPDPALNGKIMAPFLGAAPAEAVATGYVKITFSEDGFFVSFYENRYPVSMQTWPELLNSFSDLNALKKEAFPDLFLKLQPFNSVNIPDHEITNWADVKQWVIKSVSEKNALKKAISEGLEKLNADQEKLISLLDKQYFRLEFWKVTDSKINYRRFFTINELICLRMESQEVFEAYHRFIFEMTEKGFFQGLRIDHIDGLLDPTTYLNRLRKAAGENCYITVEKILELEEELPDYWPVQGTTGYYFLAILNQLLTDQSAQRKFAAIYHSQVPGLPDYETMVFEKKMYMLTNYMQGELENLFTLMSALNLLPPAGSGQDQKKLKGALQVLLAAFPVYRLYSNQLPVTGQDAAILDKAFERAFNYRPHLQQELTYFKQLFKGETGNLPASAENRLFFLMRCQQFTGPLAAKGVEDTTFYNYNWLISHNEVGDSPEVFGIGVGKFHKIMADRQQKWPLGQNATATHDTKRGEDARIRLNAISELAEEWEELLQHWKRVNLPFLRDINGDPMPSPNREYFLYQLLLGAFPMDGKPEPDFLDRVKESMTKAMREAKMYSNWSEPNEEYEQGVHAFIEAILAENSGFMQSFRPFVKKLSFYGMVYGLSQALIKITAPGIPDIYQGTELWELSMVDPDNRRPVDYETRQKLLKGVQEGFAKDPAGLIENLKETCTTGTIKLFTIWRSLQLRLQQPELFTDGAYIPLTAFSKPETKVVGFMRRKGKIWCLVLVPVAIVGLMPDAAFAATKTIWQDEAIYLPEDAPTVWKNCFTDLEITGKGSLKLADIFGSFPVVLLFGERA